MENQKETRLCLFAEGGSIEICSMEELYVSQEIKSTKIFNPISLISSDNSV
jgi:hypothetical protein